MSVFQKKYKLIRQGLAFVPVSSWLGVLWSAWLDGRMCKIQFYDEKEAVEFVDFLRKTKA